MRRRTPLSLAFFAVAGASLAVPGCAQFRPPPPGAASAGGGSCAKKALIEDGEDGDDQILTRGGRGGYVYTFADERGSKVSPAGDFVPATGGADGSHRSLRVTGNMTTGDEAYAGVGLGFKDPEAAYDATRYKGVAFWAKRSAASSGAMRFMVADVNTDPAGKVCTECDNDFGVSFEVTEEWTRYEVSFADLKQEGGWGNPRPDAIDPSKLYSLKWQVSTPGADFDIAIDQISFVCE
jgi:hypothetical protein